MLQPDLLLIAAAGVGAAMAFSQSQLDAWWEETFSSDDDGDDGDYADGEADDE